MGNFTHILEHEGYRGYDETRLLVSKNQVSCHRTPSSDF